MNEKDTRKRKDWVKNAAIIFLTIMLILTFFSNTIMNYSLPEVATQYVQRGTITAKVRGTGNVEATDPYSIIVKESRVITSVAVKQGDQVEKDQVIYYLDDAESDELKKAEGELEDLKLAYMKGLFGSSVSPEVISKVASGNVDGFGALQAKVTDMQKRLDAAEARVTECQNNVNAISLESTISTNNSSTSKIADELEADSAKADLEALEAADKDFETRKSQKIGQLTNEIIQLEAEIADLQILVSNTEEIADDVSAITPDTYVAERDAALKIAIGKLKEIKAALGTQADGILIKDNSTIDELKTNYTQLNSLINDKPEYQTLCTEYNAAVVVAVAAIQNLDSASSALNTYGNNLLNLNAKKEKLQKLKNSLTEVNAISVDSNGSVKDAQDRLNNALRNISEITYATTQSDVAYKNKLANANAALEAAKAVLDLLKEEQTNMVSDINAELDLSKANKDIAAKEEEIAKLKEKSMGAAIKAPVAGMITSLTYVAGETTKVEEAAAIIQIDGKGFTLTIAVTNDQAKKVQVGDVAELQNAWYYDDVQAILTTIKPNPDNPGSGKLLVFDVTGSSIQNGQALNISVGQRSSEYELVVPNSAVREDNNGKFILIVESKSGPIENRYIATRVDVEVLASDDNNSALSAPLVGYEYVITTSTKPVEAGKQVRLNSN